MKKLLLIIAALPIVFATACSKDETPEKNPNSRKIALETDDINEPYELNVWVDTVTVGGKAFQYFGPAPRSGEIIVADDVPYSFIVRTSPVVVGSQPDERIPYSGTISRSLFNNTTDNNIVKVIVDGLEPTLYVNGVEVTSMNGGGGSGGGSPYKGIWVRQQGASGDETDLAIGTIPGEAANRVWMCEYKGNVGLYKGTISGSTITFDSQYGLPTYTVSKDGSDLVLQANVSYSLPTNYKSGSWTSHCGQLGN